MFQITRRADYAVRMMLDLGGQPAQGWTQAADIAARTGVPLAFLHKITGKLVRADLVRTFPGPRGGLALARPAVDINLQHILEAIDGPICLNVCLVRPRECPRDRICPAHSVWSRLQSSLVEQLRAATLNRLVTEARSLQLLFPESPRGG